MAEYHIPVLELVLTMANAVDSLTRSYQLSAVSSQSDKALSKLQSGFWLESAGRFQDTHRPKMEN